MNAAMMHTTLSPRRPLTAEVRPPYISPLSRLYLPYISPRRPVTAEVHPPYISPLSRLYLAFISPTSRLYLAYISRAGGVLREAG